MAGKFSFRLQRADPRRDFPSKIVLGQHETETEVDVLLKALSFLIFFRERLLIDAALHMDAIPFRPDLVQLDYELRPKLWIECGECSVTRLDKLAVKAPDAEIWVVKASQAAVEELVSAMKKGELRQGRYNLVGLDSAMVEEMTALLRGRNEIFWVGGGINPPTMQLDLNGLWFDATFTVTPF